MEDNAVITPVAEAPTPNVDEAFKQAVLAILDDGTLDKAGKVNAIRKVLDAQEKVAEAMTPAEQPAEETPAEETPAETTESLKAEVVKLKAENEALKLLESAGIKSTAILVESLVALDSTDKRKALIASWPKQQAVKKPHSTPANLVESKTRYEDLDTVAALLLSR